MTRGRFHFHPISPAVLLSHGIMALCPAWAAGSLGVTEVTLLMEATPSATRPVPEQQRRDKESQRSHGKL